MFPLIYQKCCPTASTGLIILLNGVDEIFLYASTDVSNYMTYSMQNMFIILSSWSVGGCIWISPSSSRKVTRVTTLTTNLTCRSSMISAKARFQIEGTGCPDSLLGHEPATQAVKRSDGLARILPALHLF